jgi:nucleoside-diphosphate-sugar epimerase
MRFDLTVNEFTRDLWAGRPLEVFGEQFWRPYVHVTDAARGVALVLAQPPEKVLGKVFNVGHTDENYTKKMLVERITERLGRGDVSFVHREEDPRDYRVDFSLIRDELGYVPQMTVPDGIDEVIEGLEAERFGEPFSPSYSNIGAPA